MSTDFNIQQTHNYNGHAALMDPFDDMLGFPF